MKIHQDSEISSFLNTLKNSVWLFGVAAWAFGILDRAIAAVADKGFSAKYILQLGTAFIFFLGWLFLKPKQKI